MRSPMQEAGERDRVYLVERLVAEAIRSLPEPLRGAADELLIVVDGSTRGGLYGVFDGRPRGADDTGSLPPRITIFARPLLADFAPGAELAAEVRTTLVHEIGHYLGLEEGDLEARGLE